MVAREITTGTQGLKLTEEQIKTREQEIRDTVAKYIPDFKKTVLESANGRADMLILHQDAFAANYHEDEYVLLAMAIKFAGLHGVDLHIKAKN